MPARTGIVQVVVALGLGAQARPEFAAKDAAFHEKPRGVSFEDFTRNTNW